MNGDLKANTYLIDRIDGKPRQAIDYEPDENHCFRMEIVDQKES